MQHKVACRQVAVLFENDVPVVGISLFGVNVVAERFDLGNFFLVTDRHAYCNGLKVSLLILFDVEWQVVSYTAAAVWKNLTVFNHYGST